MLDLLISRRSIRKFQDKKIEKEKIDEIVSCALLSPSSRGIKTWDFIVVDDKVLLLELSSSKEHGSMLLSGAPLGIVVAADTQMSDVWVEDASIAAIIIQLAAQKLGLGSCWVQIRKRNRADGETAESYVKNLLSIPDRYAIECIIAIGYPHEEKAPHDPHKLMREKVHRNKFSEHK
jgi:nitroreductase